MLAFYNKQDIKNKYIHRVEQHYKADEIIQGFYWQAGKGCAVGCTMEMDNSGESVHEAMQRELGIPLELCYLEDKIFEGLTNGKAKEFPLRFLRAIKVGADLSKVTTKFKIWLLIDEHNGVIQWANVETKRIIGQVVELQNRRLNGDEPQETEWSAARSARSAHYERMADKLIELLENTQ
jgi:hypothetical protein